MPEHPEVTEFYQRVRAIAEDPDIKPFLEPPDLHAECRAEKERSDAYAAEAHDWLLHQGRHVWDCRGKPCTCGYYGLTADRPAAVQSFLARLEREKRLDDGVRKIIAYLAPRGGNQPAIERLERLLEESPVAE